MDNKKLIDMMRYISSMYSFPNRYSTSYTRDKLDKIKSRFDISTDEEVVREIINGRNTVRTSNSVLNGIECMLTVIGNDKLTREVDQVIVTDFSPHNKFSPNMYTYSYLYGGDRLKVTRYIMKALGTKIPTKKQCLINSLELYSVPYKEESDGILCDISHLNLINEIIKITDSIDNLNNIQVIEIGNQVRLVVKR